VTDAEIYLLLADTILIIHFLLVVFVVFGFVAILAGRGLGWRWIYRAAFRVTHLSVIGIVVLQAWLGRLCPLTVWENNFRSRAGASGYSETFVQHWLQQLLFYAAPSWLFAVIYTVFGGLVILLFCIDRGAGDKLEK
jgi:polyferredoxin